MTMMQEKKTYSIYIGSLPRQISKEDIMSFFSKQGFFIRISKKKSKPSKRYYVVETSDFTAYQ